MTYDFKAACELFYNCMNGGITVDDFLDKHELSTLEALRIMAEVQDEKLLLVKTDGTEQTIIDPAKIVNQDGMCLEAGALNYFIDQKIKSFNPKAGE